MSDYFKNQGDGREFGPGPMKETWWLVVDPWDDMTKIAYVCGKTAHEAKQQAVKYIPELSNRAVFYPNTVRYPSDR